ncbi:hypothetical protein LDENG_00051320 [Lucifuga dentata]|nr:hypothetical protein LDENG_00051320 [Lucifuga dentata]
MPFRRPPPSSLGDYCGCRDWTMEDDRCSLNTRTTASLRDHNKFCLLQLFLSGVLNNKVNI